eukprot:319428-Pyramimonas_sp.AAC.1
MGPTFRRETADTIQAGHEPTARHPTRSSRKERSSCNGARRRGPTGWARRLATMLGWQLWKRGFQRSSSCTWRWTRRDLT